MYRINTVKGLAHNFEDKDIHNVPKMEKLINVF